jgi:hypothetical protein
MEKNSVVSIVSKFNSILYNAFSVLPDPFGRILVGLIYAMIITIIFNFFDKDYLRIFVWLFMILFLLQWFNLVSFNMNVIRNVIGVDSNARVMDLFNGFVSTFGIEFISFIIAFFLLLRTF